MYIYDDIVGYFKNWSTKKIHKTLCQGINIAQLQCMILMCVQYFYSNSRRVKLKDENNFYLIFLPIDRILTQRISTFC